MTHTLADRRQHAEAGDPETQARIAQYEMAFRMQTSVPELTDLSDEPQSTPITSTDPMNRITASARRRNGVSIPRPLP